jgi:hypothetical protein
MAHKVVILGCGPTGLAAAVAAIDSGYKVLIASQTDQPSTQYGCQYLHAPIPGYEDVPHTRVSYHLNGTADEYRRKVYGSHWSGKVSPEDFVGEHKAWDIRATYQRMWSDLHNHKNVKFVQTIRIDYGFLPSAVFDFNPEAIISTIPAPRLCFTKSHFFLNHVIYAIGSTNPVPGAEDVVLCDGTDQHDWYRVASVFGYNTTEWPSNPNLPDAKVVAVPKPLTTNCDCHVEIHRVGRYGKWQKSTLVHETYPEVMKILK